MGHEFYISKKLILKIKKNLQSIVNIFIFFIKILCQSKEYPLPKQSPLIPTLPLLEKIFHPYPCQIAKLEEVNPPLFRKDGVFRQ